jgi:hypothetical protein
LFLPNRYWELSATACCLFAAATSTCAAGVAGYGVSLARPFARRRLITRRPAFVAIRARNPCVRARFILLGWYVRFICLLPETLVRRGRPSIRKGGKGTQMVFHCQ